jgi:hypothetical protein
LRKNSLDKWALHSADRWVHGLAWLGAAPALLPTRTLGASDRGRRVERRAGLASASGGGWVARGGWARHWAARARVRGAQAAGPRGELGHELAGCGAGPCARRRSGPRRGCGAGMGRGSWCCGGTAGLSEERRGRRDGPHGRGAGSAEDFGWLFISPFLTYFLSLFTYFFCYCEFRFWFINFEIQMNFENFE